MSTSRPSRPGSRPQPAARQPTSAPPEIVDPRWILKAAVAVLALGLLCAYLSLCAFFYVEQWQFVLHPSKTVSATPASLGLPSTPVRFGNRQGGQGELSGFWIPGDQAADPTVLLLHGASGSLSDAVPVARALHAAHLQVLLFDYRGYGQSGGDHPTQARMEADAEEAFHYLTATRGIPANRLVAMGQDLGASLAVRLCTRHPEIAGLVLLDADGDTTSRVIADQRSRVVPVRLLFHERFPLADPLHALATPKLILSNTRGPAPEVAQRAADPKMTVEVPVGANDQALTESIQRFLSTYLPHPPALL